MSPDGNDQFRERLRLVVGPNTESFARASNGRFTGRTLRNWLTQGGPLPNASDIAELSRLSKRSIGWFFGEAPSGDISQAPAAQQDTVRISVLDVRAAAGIGHFNDKAVEVEAMELPRPFLRKLGANARTTDSLRAIGDSMAPTIEDGAFLLVDRSKDEIPPLRSSSRPRLPDVFVFVYGHDLRVKRIERLRPPSGTGRDWPMMLALISDNFAVHPPEIVEAGSVTIIGKVVWWDNRL